ncbi:uncharacterized protein LOC144440221 [Glandiceps talaboti]
MAPVRLTGLFLVLCFFLNETITSTNIIFYDTVIENGRVEMTCETSIPHVEYYIWYQDGNFFENTSNDFLIINALRRYAGDYSCQAMSNASSETSDNRYLNVLYAPGDPWPECSIDVESTDYMKEGDTIRILCRAIDGNPHPTLEWFDNITGDPLPDSVYSTPSPSDDPPLTTNEVEWDLTSDDNGKIFRCEGDHDVTSTKICFTDELDVKYAPYHPSCTLLDDITYQENTQIEIICTAVGGNPLATLRWINGSSHELLDEIGTPSSGTETSLTYQQIVNRSDNQMDYLCNATNLVLSEPLTCNTGPLIVHFAPKAVHLTGYEPVVKSGDVLDLTCTSESSNPRPSIQWYKNDSELTDNEQEKIGEEEYIDGDFHGTITRQVLSIRLSAEHNTVHFQCEATHTEYDNVESDKLHPVVFFAPSEPSHCDTSLNGPVGPLLEYESLELMCTSCSSNPEADIVWYKDQVPITTGVSATTYSDGWYNGVISTSTFTEEVDYRDHGKQYHCETSNREFDEEFPSNTVYLNVHYVPKLLNANSTSRVEADEGELTKLLCEINCNPLGTITWFDHYGDVITQSATHSITEVKRRTVTSSTLTIDRVAKRDHGLYKCSGGNTIGLLNFSITFTGKTRPDAATDVTVNDKTENTFLVTWTPGDDCGDTQTFYCEYRKSDNNSLWNRTSETSYSNTTIKDLESDTEYEIRVVSLNTFGSESSETVKNSTLPITGRGTPVIAIVLPVLSTFLILAIVVIAVIFVYHRKANIKKTTKDDKSTSRPYVDVHLDDIASPVSTKPYEGLIFNSSNQNDESQLGRDNYEIDVEEPITGMSFNDLTILGNISVGLFTKMVKAKVPLQGIGQVTVCAKLLKDNLNEEAKNCLRREIDFMKNLPRHPHLATMMRYCVDDNPMFCVLEYFPYGSLKSYLRETRDGYKTDTNGNLGNNVDLLLMALQVARGMAFLEENEWVLRMLSARTLQVGCNKVCKISEFSFCTSVMDHPTYERITVKRLPIRWLALESIIDSFYSSKTDVWSYGIVLWEILNLGDDPYPEMTVEDVLYELQQGYRMPKPSHCSVQMYSLMADCWDEDPSERPSFDEITNRIENEIRDLHDTK